MGTKTADETGAETGSEAKSDDVKSGNETVDITKDEQPTEAAADTEVEVLGDADEYEGDDLNDLDEAELAAERAESSGVGQGAAAVVSAVLGFVSLTGSWLGTVAGARETLVGQLGTASSASVATQIKEVYGDAWQTTALWGGVFALAALLVGVAALARPAFGAPGKPQAVWIRSVSWAGVALGVLGLLIAVLKYTDVLLGLPSAT
ncbi:hypothetical protein ACKI1I_23250 [Streptomyces turgidiscabies]|uniref:Uncharacterized protein n=1 Tax=Streptomyces turgidiscabies (strain Car8) TaxID=698760 RepID=L7ETJ8_STRT8|nr:MULTISPECIES: hypothetical protein [Streptomyces]ELP62199.1 hypothetical protein STRTUCAR8_07733 [Streptomyces turgidiscabies Car8]MDX3496780.1 hypothetical protein [Streptomyces turgidiscabies]GAQ74114.1 hypothetical protein T45_05885 [Streptomyces turgidiscabies]